MQKCAVPSPMTVLLVVCVSLAGYVFGLPHESSFYNATGASACQTNTDCSSDKVCSNEKCSDPCVPDFCGKNTFCYVANHNPICCGQRHLIRGESPMLFESASQAQPPSTTARTTSTTPAQTERTTAARRESTTLSPSEITTPVNFQLLLQPSDDESPPSQRYNNSQSSGGNPGSIRKQFHLNTIIKMNWHQAWAHCRSMDMDLASLEDDHEYDTLYRIIKQSNVKKADYWLSGTDLGEFGDFLWMATGRPVSSSNWNPGEPNHYNYGEEIEHCIGLNWGFDWKMNDNKCSMNLYHVCQSY